MKQIGLVTIALRAISEGAVSSFSSVCDVLVASQGARDAVAKLLPDMVDTEFSSSVGDLLFDRGNLLDGETVLRTADGAVEIVLKPAQRYLEFVAAIASDGDVTCDFDFHGWPLLTLGSGVPSVTEPLGASSLGRGGSDA